MVCVIVVKERYLGNEVCGFHLDQLEYTSLELTGGGEMYREYRVGLQITMSNRID